MGALKCMKDVVLEYCIIVRCLFAWKVKPGTEEELRSAHVIIAQSLGLRGKKPGISNEALAKIVFNLHYRYGLPLVLQWEIADCLPHTVKAGVVRQHQEKEEYLDTHEVLSQEWEICTKKGWTRAIVVAHQDHMWRVVRTAENIGFHAVPANVRNIPYDSLSSQSWTRSRARFILREIGARFFYFLKGWLQ